MALQLQLGAQSVATQTMRPQLWRSLVGGSAGAGAVCARAPFGEARIREWVQVRLWQTVTRPSQPSTIDRD